MFWQIGDRMKYLAINFPLEGQLLPLLCKLFILKMLIFQYGA